jgi:methyltransferase FkbM-like protein
VRSTTLNTLREGFGFSTIDLLKIDIEGMESEVLGGDIGSVRAIAAELHGSYTDADFARDVAPRTCRRSPGADPIIAVPVL